MFLDLLRRVGLKRAAPTASIVRWSILFNSGVMVAFDGAADPAAQVPFVEDETGREILRLTDEVISARYGDVTIVHYRLDRAFFDRRQRCRIVVQAPGIRYASDMFDVRPGSFVGSLDHVEDYCLVGWVSPLFNTVAFQVELLVDDKAFPPQAPNLFRKDFIYLSAHGGWNGIRLPLPAEALDGAPHELAVQAGDTRLRLPPWTAKPQFGIDLITTESLVGWFSDASLVDGPATLRLMAGEHEVARARTSRRGDADTPAGRTLAGFAFGGVGLRPGLELVVGPNVVARVTEGDLAAQVCRGRAEARRALLAAADPGDSFAGRLLVRQRLALERAQPSGTLALEPASSTPVELDGSGAEARTSPPTAVPPVCVVVPVYKGVDDVRACVQSVLPQLSSARARLVIVNDASPEPAVHRYLEQLANEGHAGVTIRTNPANLGFVETVNRGLGEVAPGEDAAIVNADTILPRKALAKLARACHGAPGVASVTPMSNNATILSFPVPRVANAPLMGLDVNALDAAFEAFAQPALELPTGIGFCMYLNRQALDEVGSFSTKWGRGYCEEVEWSLVARDLGWVHLAAMDTFVMHEGSVSFGVAERNEILLTNHAALEALFPEYLSEVRDICWADPFEPARSHAFAALLARSMRRVTLHVMHGLGGGTKRYVDDLAALPRVRDHEFATAVPVVGDFGLPMLRFSFAGSNSVVEIGQDRMLDFVGCLEGAGLSVTLHLDSRLTLPSETLSRIAEGTTPYEIILHDFQWYCPKVNLLNETRFYCGEPPPQVCQLCVRHGQIHDFGDQDELIKTDIDSWLAFNMKVLRGARAIVAPSQDTRRRYEARLGLDSIVVKPHPETIRASLPAGPERDPAKGGAMRIAIVGAIGDHKGYELLERLAEVAALQRAPVYFRVVGYTRDDARLARLPNLDTTGRYDGGDLKQQLDAFRPAFVLLPSPWPETYSYVLSEVWNAGYPVVAFDLGAPGERIRDSGLGVLVRPTRDAVDLLRSLESAAAELASRGPMSWTVARAASLEDYEA